MIRKTNREQTFAAVMAIIQDMERTLPKPADETLGFTNLPVDRKLQIAMQFYQCERARLQKGKMLLDTIGHLGPWAVALYALLHTLG
jgi:hypothetical protein